MLASAWAVFAFAFVQIIIIIIIHLGSQQAGTTHPCQNSWARLTLEPGKIIQMSIKIQIVEIVESIQTLHDRMFLFRAWATQIDLWKTWSSDK